MLSNGNKSNKLVNMRGGRVLVLVSVRYVCGMFGSF